MLSRKMKGPQRQPRIRKGPRRERQALHSYDCSQMSLRACMQRYMHLCATPGCTISMSTDVLLPRG